jgi:hypothetical protein
MVHFRNKNSVVFSERIYFHQKLLLELSWAICSNKFIQEMIRAVERWWRTDLDLNLGYDASLETDVHVNQLESLIELILNSQNCNVIVTTNLGVGLLDLLWSVGIDCCSCQVGDEEWAFILCHFLGDSHEVSFSVSGDLHVGSSEQGVHHNLEVIVEFESILSYKGTAPQ